MGIPVQRLKREITSQEFVDYGIRQQQRRNDDVNRKEVIHFYLAQIAMEVCRKFSKHPEEFKIEHFMLEFESGVKEKEKEVPEAMTQDWEAGKAAWLSFLGVG